jgi:hypothetical protein
MGRPEHQEQRVATLVHRLEREAVEQPGVADPADVAVNDVLALRAGRLVGELRATASRPARPGLQRRLLPVEIEDTLDDRRGLTADKYTEFKVVAGESGNGDVRTADVGARRIRREDFEVRPRRVEPQTGNQELGERAGSADRVTQLVECVIGVRGSRREEHLKRNPALGRCRQRITEERKTGSIHEWRREPKRLPRSRHELREGFGGRVAQPGREVHAGWERGDEIAWLGADYRAATEDPHGTLAARGTYAIDIGAEPPAQDVDEIGIEADSSGDSTVGRRGRQQ